MISKIIAQEKEIEELLPQTREKFFSILNEICKLRNINKFILGGGECYIKGEPILFFDFEKNNIFEFFPDTSIEFENCWETMKKYPEQVKKKYYSKHNIELFLTKLQYRIAEIEQKNQKILEIQKKIIEVN